MTAAALDRVGDVLAALHNDVAVYRTVRRGVPLLFDAAEAMNRSAADRYRNGAGPAAV